MESDRATGSDSSWIFLLILMFSEKKINFVRPVYVQRDVIRVTAVGRVVFGPDVIYSYCNYYYYYYYRCS